ncbi:hypothetical protein R3P38DRAFT_3197745 [Favolaschia claudopus]|uniref:Uncharacterized protein n=1 Tax=Favolaschia claudopus TaxID=2862362 RepID=A0AAW0B2S8_9AGAR
MNVMVYTPYQLEAHAVDLYIYPLPSEPLILQLDEPRNTEIHHDRLTSIASLRPPDLTSFKLSDGEGARKEERNRFQILMHLHLNVISLVALAMMYAGLATALNQAPPAPEITAAPIEIRAALAPEPQLSYTTTCWCETIPYLTTMFFTGTDTKITATPPAVTPVAWK